MDLEVFCATYLPDASRFATPSAGNLSAVAVISTGQIKLAIIIFVHISVNLQFGVCLVAHCAFQEYEL